MPVLRNIGQLAQCRAEGGQGDIHAVAGAALAWDGGAVRWVGPERELPSEFAAWPSEDAGGRLVIPGLVDCHTHLAFGGWRADEFAMRCEGRTYQEIVAAGGGIVSTMRHTREASTGDLVRRARGFLGEMATLGVTTVECKTGYGLDEPTELRLLDVYDQLRREGPQRIVATLLAAHVVPPEHRAQREAYVRLVIERIIPAAAGRARFCDVFVEEGAFSVDEARRILEAGLVHGLQPKLHADQLSASGGSELAADVGAASADHLEYVTPAGVSALRQSGTVAVSLPLASLYLRQPPLPARALIEGGVPVAVATDFNPGSAPSLHLPLALTLACITQRMTPAEALKGATIIAAHAIGADAECGSLEAGKAADFALIDAPDVNQWLYHLRPNACQRTVCGGITIHQAAP